MYNLFILNNYNLICNIKYFYFSNRFEESDSENMILIMTVKNK